ncbi:hypothetical protein NPIL_275071 [Nephila pilipes]|uniref:Uncharacterized protein n=1 Tax=Nephila pilipes TaxID=299642 RepID=A0A8X6NN13_NEPPI|nr:hypothetical protein NPIL_275071 [Nephila pilipes]
MINDPVILIQPLRCCCQRLNYWQPVHIILNIARECQKTPDAPIILDSPSPPYEVEPRQSYITDGSHLSHVVHDVDT